MVLYNSQTNHDFKVKMLRRASENVAGRLPRLAQGLLTRLISGRKRTKFVSLRHLALRL